MFKEEVRKDVMEKIGTFFQVEQGNRVTVNNFSSLINTINQSFDTNREVPKPPDKPKEKEKDA